MIIIPRSFEQLLKLAASKSFSDSYSAVSLMEFGKIYRHFVWAYPEIRFSEAMKFLFKTVRVPVRPLGNVPFPSADCFFDVSLKPGDFEGYFEKAVMFINSISGIQSFFSFAIFGNSDQIRITFGCSNLITGPFLAAVKGVFPTIVLTPVLDPLKDISDQETNVREYYNQAPFFLPLTSFENFTVLSPLNLLFQAISSSERYSGIEFLFTPAFGQDFHSLIQESHRLQFRSAMELASYDLGRQQQDPSLYLPFLAKQVNAKANPDRPFFFSVIRTVGECVNIQNFLSLYRYGEQPLGFNDACAYPPGQLLSILKRRKTKILPLLLNSNEFAAMLHLIPISISAEKSSFPVSRNVELPLPKELEAGELVLGFNSSSGVSKEVFIPKKHNRGCYVIGTSGSGKSWFINSLCLQTAKAGGSFCIICPDGSTADEFLLRVPDNRVEDVVVFDPSLPDYFPVFNPFITSPQIDSGKYCDEISESFKVLLIDPGTGSPSWGYNLQNFFRFVLYVAHKKGLSFAIAKKLISPKTAIAAERAEILKDLDNPEVENFWTKQIL